MNIFKAINPKTAEKLHTIYFIYFRKTISFTLYLLALTLLRLKFKRKGMLYLLLATRLNCTSEKVKSLKVNLLKRRKCNETFLNLTTIGISQEEAAGRTIILSLPKSINGKIIKGVILIKFTKTLSFYNRNSSLLSNLDKFFVFIIEPSSAGYADADILYFLENTTNSLIQSAEITDRALINAIYPDVKTLSFGSSNWVDSNIFKPTVTDKVYDSIYVSNMNHIKRSFKYVDAIKKIVTTRDENYHGCLVCASWGGQQEPLNQYIKKQGLDKNLTYFSGLSRERLIDELNKSKVNVLLSLKEGSNRSLFESMFVDIPVICLSENIGVNKSYINEHTGCLVPEFAFNDALVAMKENYKAFNPKKWADHHISAQRTVLDLEDVLNAKFGEGCNSQLYIKVNKPEAEYQSLACSGFELSKLLLSAFNETDHEQQLQVIETIRQLLIDAAEVVK